MRSIPTALNAKLSEGVTNLALAWRLTRSDGVIVGLTQHDRDFQFDGTLFKAASSFTSADHERELGLGPDRTAISGALNANTISEADLKLGRWDGAKIEAFWVDWTNPADFIAMWCGLIAGANWRGSAFELDVVGQEAALNQEIGQVYARTCNARFGDGRCGVDLDVPAHRIVATLISVSSDRDVAIAAPAGKLVADFQGGTILITNGPASGWTSGIHSITPSPTGWEIAITRPFPVMPVVGNAVLIQAGCDKTFATCKSRFANHLNFRGQPHMPGDDVAFGGPAATGNNGGKR
jgi:uncharacterized phage protein (TIGR02218 family)